MDSRDTLSLADRLLLEHGELDPFECLLGLGFIDPADNPGKCATPIPIDCFCCALIVLSIASTLTEEPRAR